ncbi:MAG: hypothetical protein CMJ46_08690 [Planctomyces sp.]|nr:hypothetical protein [Planctomyces sp.]
MLSQPVDHYFQAGSVLLNLGMSGKATDFASHGFYNGSDGSVLIQANRMQVSPSEIGQGNLLR